MNEHANVSRLEQSFLALSPHLFQFSQSYLQRLLTQYPFMSNWLDDPIELYADRLTRTLQFLFQQSQNPNELLPKLKSLAALASQHNVLPEHIQLMATLMLDHLEACFNESFDHELKQQWELWLMWLVAWVMRAEEEYGIYSY